MTTLTMTILRAGSSAKQDEAADLPNNPTFEDLEDLISPIVAGPIERLQVVAEDSVVDMFVNEHAHRDGFEINDAATALYRRGRDAETLSDIKGTAVVFDRMIPMSHREEVRRSHPVRVGTAFANE